TAAGDGRDIAASASASATSGPTRQESAGDPGAREGDTRRLGGALDEAATERLRRAARARGEPLGPRAVAGLAVAWSRETGARSLPLEIERHGRDAVPGLDVSRTVGWFTRLHPVILEGIDPGDSMETLAAVRGPLRAEAGDPPRPV